MPTDGGWGPGGSRGRPGRGRRFFDYGELRYVVLALIGEQPRHGYDIIRAIEQRTGGAYCPSPGVIYPTLSFLVDVGHLHPAAEGGTRNCYEITADGRAYLVENSSLVEEIFSRMRQSDPASPVIVTAMDGLKAALQRGPQRWSAQEAKAVAAAIDAAAQRIRALADRSSQADEPDA